MILIGVRVDDSPHSPALNFVSAMPTGKGPADIAPLAGNGKWGEGLGTLQGGAQCNSRVLDAGPALSPQPSQRVRTPWPVHRQAVDHRGARTMSTSSNAASPGAMDRCSSDSSAIAARWCSRAWSGLISATISPCSTRRC